MATSTLPTQLADIRVEKSSTAFRAAPEPVSNYHSTAAGFGIIRDPKFEAYLQTIVTRLMEHWHGEKPERVGVFVESGSSTVGKATPSGDILIPIGAFDGLTSEDQLAALIGHELGHVVLKHHEDERQAKELAKLGEYAVAIAFAASSIQNGEMRRNGNTREFRVTRPGAVQNDTLRAFALHSAMVTLTQDIILSAYSRDQEYAADVFGATLAGRAGWEPRALLSLIQQWQDAEEAVRLKKQELMQSAGFSTAVVQGIGDFAASITSSHPDAAARSEFVAKEIQVQFANTTPLPPTTDSFNKAINAKSFARKRSVWRDINRARVLMEKNDIPGAIAILQALRKQPDAAHPESRYVMALAFGSLGTPEGAKTAYDLLATADLRQPATLTVYDQFALEHADHGNWRQAEEVIEIGEKSYREKMLPTRIQVLRIQSAGSTEPPKHLLLQMSELMQRCQASSESGLAESCRAAATGANPDSDYQVCGGVINAIASVVGEGKCDQGQQAKASTSGGGLVSGVFGNIKLGKPRP